MEFRTLTQDEYDRSLRSILADTEGLHPEAQDVGDGKATIGWGYTLNRHNNVEIWERSVSGTSPIPRVDRHSCTAEQKS